MPEEFELLTAFVNFQVRGFDNISRELTQGAQRATRTVSALDRLSGTTTRLSRNSGNAATSLDRQERETRDVAGATDNASRSEDAYGDELIRTIRLLRDRQGLQRNLGGGFRGAIGAGIVAGGANFALNAASRAASALANTASDAAREGLRLAVNYEQAQIRIGAFAGGAEEAQSILDDLQRFGATTDFNFLDDLVPAAQQLLAADITDQRGLIPLLSQLGDIRAGATNADLNLIIANLAQIQNVGRASLQDIRQFGNQGIPIFSELAAVTGATGEELGRLISDGQIGLPEITAAFQNLTGEGGRFFGLLEASSNSTAGVLSNLEDNADTLRRQFGDALLPAVNEFASALNQLANDGTLEDIGNAISEWGPLLGNATQDALGLTAALLEAGRSGPDQSDSASIGRQGIIDGGFNGLRLLLPRRFETLLVDPLQNLQQNRFIEDQERRAQSRLEADSERRRIDDEQSAARERNRVQAAADRDRERQLAREAAARADSIQAATMAEEEADQARQRAAEERTQSIERARRASLTADQRRIEDLRRQIEVLRGVEGQQEAIGRLQRFIEEVPVSYTHLTLPTILRV